MQSNIMKVVAAGRPTTPWQRSSTAWSGHADGEPSRGYKHFFFNDFQQNFQSLNICFSRIELYKNCNAEKIG